MKMRQKRTEAAEKMRTRAVHFPAIRAKMSSLLSFIFGPFPFREL